jgi:hypothetical protein
MLGLIFGFEKSWKIDSLQKIWHLGTKKIQDKKVIKIRIKQGIYCDL